MAARLNLRQQDQSRAAIQTSQLINRLQNYALGKVDKGDKAIEIDAGRLRAIEILLRKTLPDVSSVTLTGDAERPLEINVTVGGT
jgi:hypothetical protein